MTTSDYIAATSLFIALVAFIISILDWLQIGREDPWTVEWASNGSLILKRLHYWPVWVENIHNFHGGKIHVLNDAAHIPWPMQRNSHQLIRVQPVIEGTFITVCYRRLRTIEVFQVIVADFIARMPRKSRSKTDALLTNVQNKIRVHPGKYWNLAELQGKRAWSTPIIKK